MLLGAASAQALPTGVQIFEDGSAGMWSTSFMGASNPSAPTAAAPGNPGVNASGGVLELSATGDPAGPMMQPGGRLNAFNASPLYTGDYANAGIRGFAMDLFNPSDITLGIKVMVMSFNDDFSALLGASFSELAFSLAPGESATAFFSLEGGALEDLFGDLATTLSDVDSLRIFHNPDAGGSAKIGGAMGLGDFAPFVTASLQIDNITTIVPEPATALLLGLGLVAVSALHRRQDSATSSAARTRSAVSCPSSKAV